MYPIAKAHHSTSEKPCLKTTGTLKKQTKLPPKLNAKKILCQQKGRKLEHFCSPFPYEIDVTRHFLTENSNIDSFADNSVLEFNFERFYNAAIWGKFNLKYELQMIQTQTKNWRNRNHENIEMKKKLYHIFSFRFVKISKHEVQDMSASLKNQVIAAIADQKHKTCISRATNENVH